MADLSITGVHQYWSQYKDPIIYRVVSYMESVEKWTSDGEELFEKALKKLGDALDNIGNIDLKGEDFFIDVANQLREGRSLRLLQVIDQAHPGAASKLLMYAEEQTDSTEDMHGLFLRRNVVFERLRLLSRVFSPYRFSLILKALEEDHD